MHTTRFRQIFTPPLPPKNGAKKSKNKSKVKDPKKLKVKDPELQRLSNEAHLADWILVVSSLLQWHQWMKQSTISKAQVTKSHCAVQWLMRQMASVSPRASGMGNNTIKTHLVLHLSEDILDHGVPENVNSAYAESAHIPLSKITARNTQKRAKTFTRQAAHRYIENLAIASAWQDMQQDIIHKGGSSFATAAGKSGEDDALPTMSGRQFTISRRVGDPSPSFRWNRTYPTDNPGGDSLSRSAMHFLGQHCLLPFLTDGKLPCFTEFICVNGHKYRAHPSIYDGKPWNDHAMVEWHGFQYPLPAFIHTFVDLRHLPRGARIALQESGQPSIKEAGVYALIHSFDAIDEEVREFSTQ
ncbi:hypothetical protein MHU86_24629 [Fragilaria crotonensis]|nr:hypothetical protein MHU86_24629 [Fragilaria crotonensis]